MRWFWVDRFTEFVSGQRATAVKTVTLIEDAVDNYMPRFPMLPASVIVEGLAQTGGLLVSEHSQFLERVVLAKVGRVEFHRPVFPGDRLTYTAEIREFNSLGAIVKGRAEMDQGLVAEMELVFAHLDDRFPSQLFGPGDLLEILHLFRLYEVATDANGRPLEIPAHLQANTEA